MRLILYLLFILMPMQMMAKSTLATTDIVDEQHLLKLLDQYIDRRNLYTEQKEEKIKQLKLKLRIADNNTSRLSILNTIYREYYTYRYDSAMVYVNRGLSLALSDNNTYYVTLNRINRAAVLSTGGFYSWILTRRKYHNNSNNTITIPQHGYTTTGNHSVSSQNLKTITTKRNSIIYNKQLTQHPTTTWTYMLTLEVSLRFLKTHWARPCCVIIQQHLTIAQ